MLFNVKPYWEGWLFSAKDAEGGKPLRALIIRRLCILLPKIHNLLELVEGLRDGGLPVNEVMDYLRDLNSYYLVSRFPDAANGVLSEVYLGEDG